MASNTVLAKMAVQIAANTAQFNSALSQSNKHLSAFQKTAISTAKTLVGGFGVYQVYNAFKSGISIIADFEKQMSKVRAITGATGDNFAALEKNALDLGKSTEYTARQIAGLQVEYGRLGFSTKEILNSTKATLNLATATGEDLARSAEIAGSTLRAFQLDATEMGRVTDVITGALNKSALALDTFADGMKYVAPVAEATNVSIEETSAMLGVLADAGIKGSQAGTSLRRIFTLLDKSGKPLAERMQELADKGITLADANDEVGLYAQTALLVLSKQNDRVKELTKTFEGLNGEAQRTADIMRDNLSGDFDKLKSAIEGVVLEGGAFNGFFRSVTQGLTDVVSLLNEEAIPAWQRYLQFVSLPVTGLASGAAGLFYTADAVADLNKEIKDFGADSPNPLVETYAGAAFWASELVKKTAEEARLRKEAADAAERERKELEEAFRTSEEDRAERSVLHEAILARKNADPSQTLGGFTATNPESEITFNQAVAASYASIAEKIKLAEAASLDNQRAIEEQNDAYIRMSLVASDAIAQGIASEKTFAQVLAGTTATIVDNLERQALAAIIASSAKNSFNPIAAIIGATAGFAAIKGLFAKISRGKSSVGGGGESSPISSASTRINYGSREAIPITGEFVVSGTNLKAVIKNQDRVDGVIKG